MIYLKFRKTRKVKFKIGRWKEITKFRKEINEMDTKITIPSMNETKSWFFEKISKIDKPLAKLTKRERIPKLRKLEMKKGILQQISLTFRGSLGNISKTYILINWKI
jgi:hypothetical protein